MSDMDGFQSTFGHSVKLESKLSSSLPSQRARYIEHHPSTQTAALHSAEGLIAPVWANVSSTPWEAKAKLLSGGYGVSMHRTKISEDCPAFFFNPHKEYHYDCDAPRPSYFTGSHRTKKADIGNEACYVLPGGESVLAATQKARDTSTGQRSYRIYNDGKRGLLLNISASARAQPEPIKWDTSRTTTARSVLSQDTARASPAPPRMPNDTARSNANGKNQAVGAGSGSSTLRSAGLLSQR